MTDHSSNRSGADDIVLRIGREELIVHNRYEFLSIGNDFLIATWFLVGSVLFLYPEQQKVAAWIFIIGSVQFIVRPALRLARHLQLRRLPSRQSDM